MKLRDKNSLTNHHGIDFTKELIQQLVVPTFVLDAQHKVIVWNKACEELSGMMAEEVIGTRNHWRAFYSTERPCLADLLVGGDVARISEYYPTHHQSREVSEGMHAETWCVMPLRGKSLYLEIDAGPIYDGNGNLIAVVETLRDMSLRKETESRLRSTFECSPDPVWIIEEGHFIECNDAAMQILGYRSKDEFLFRHPSRLSPPFQEDGEDSYEKSERMMMIAAQKGLHRFEWLHTRADGKVFTAEVTLSLIERSGRKVFYCAWRDVSDRKRSEDELRLYARAFAHSGEAILITDAFNRIITVNRALEESTGYCRDELVGKDPKILAAKMTPYEEYQQMWESLHMPGHWQGELWDRRKDGSVYPKWAAISAVFDAKGQRTNFIASYTNISERKAAEARIDHLAHHDSLTNLLNRYSLKNRLGQSLVSARRESALLAVLFIDLDRFKVINDTLGHHVGDTLLVEVARRLTSSVRESDIVARLGGDEFVVTLTALDDAMGAALVAGKIVSALSAPYRIEGMQLHTTPSIGVSLFPENGNDAETLMKNADAAMYEAKENGRNRFCFFSPEMTVAAMERLEIERDLRNALTNGEFELHYQPQVCSQNNQIHGVEALIRWRHPLRGSVSPLKFIPIAEETGLIEEIGIWVLNEACRQMSDWRRMGFDLKHVAVNLSACQLRSPELVNQVKSAIASFGLLPGELALEITESVAMDDPERAIGQLRALRDNGVELAIDDFGTGYSSLAYLKMLPIHTLKLDRAFVRDIESDENDAAICAATLALAKNLGLRVVAEGVETEAQRNYLIRHSCELLQGYLFGKPEPAEVLSSNWGGRPAL